MSVKSATALANEIYLIKSAVKKTKKGPSGAKTYVPLLFCAQLESIATTLPVTV